MFEPNSKDAIFEPHILHIFLRNLDVHVYKSLKDNSKELCIPRDLQSFYSIFICEMHTYRLCNIKLYFPYFIIDTVT